MSNYYDNLDDDNIIKILSENDNYIVELIIGDNNQYVVRKRLVNFELQKEFIDKANTLYDFGKFCNPNFAKVHYINHTQSFYIVDYVKGINLSDVINNIDIRKDKEDLEALKKELGIIIIDLQDAGYYCTKIDLDSFIIDNSGELIWFNFHNLATTKPENDAFEEFCDLLDDIKNEKLEEIETQKREEQLKIEEEKRKHRRQIKIYIICVLAFIATMILLFTPIVNYTLAWFRYDEIIESESCYITSLDDKFGLLDNKYKIIVDTDYDQKPERNQFGNYTVSYSNKVGLVKPLSGVLFNCEWDVITEVADNYYVVALDSKLHIYQGATYLLGDFNKIDYNKKYNTCAVHRGKNSLNYSLSQKKYVYTEKDYIVNKSKGSYGFIDVFGNILIKHQYVNALPFKNGGSVVSQVKEGKKYYGVINTNNEKLLSIKYQAIIDFNSTSAIIKDNDSYGVVTLPREYMVASGYEWISRLEKGGYAVTKYSKTMNIDNNGKFVYRDSDLIPRKLKDSSTSGWGYVDLFGKTVIEPKWCEAGYFHDGKARVEVWGWIWNDVEYINKNGY